MMNGGLGLGIQLNATNKGGPAIAQFTGQITGLKQAANEAAGALGKLDSAGRMRDAKGKFVAGGGGGGSGGGGGGYGPMGGGAQAFAGGNMAGHLKNLDMSGALQDVDALGHKFTAIGTGALGGFMTAKSAATDFQFAIAQISTVTDEASFSTADLRKTTMAMAETYGGDAITQAGALYETISAGVTDAKKATDLLGVANRFAIGGTADLQGSVDVLTSAVNTYADSGLTAQQASDMMFTAIAAGKTTAQQLSQSLGEVAPSAKAAGVSFGELQAAIAALTLQGIKTPQAMTGLNALLSNIQQPSKEAGEEAKRLGIEFSATALKSKGLAGVLAQLKGHTKLTDESMVNLFGAIDGRKAALALAADGGSKFNEIIGQMGKAAGATDAAFQKMNATDKLASEQFKAIGKNALILMGDVFKPMVAQVTQVGSTVLQWFTRLPAPAKEAIGKFGLAATALTLFVGVMLTAGAALGGLVIAAKAVGVGFLIAFAPITAVIAAVVLAVVGFKTAVDHNLGGAGAKFASFVAGAKLAWTALSEMFTLGGPTAAIAAELQKAENSWLLLFVQNVYALGTGIVHFGKSLQAGFVGVIATMGPAFDRLGTSFVRIGSALGLLSDDSREAHARWEAFGKAGMVVGTILGKGFGVVVSAVTAGLEVLGGFTQGWGVMREAISPAITALASVGGYIRTVAQSMGILSPGSHTNGWVKFGQVIAATVATVSGSIATVVRVASGLYIGISSAVDMVTAIMAGDWTRAWASGKRAALGLLMVVVEVAGKVVGAVAAMIDGLVNSLPEDLRPSGFTGHNAKNAVDGFIKDARAWNDAQLQGDATGTQSTFDAESARQRRADEAAAITAAATPADPMASWGRLVDYIKAPPEPKVTNRINVFIDGSELAARFEEQKSRDTDPGVR